jgi:trans-2,3-dihydro-3-hydroxyanthranilate isomerase
MIDRCEIHAFSLITRCLPPHAIVRQATAIGRPNVLTLDVENGNITVGGRVMPAGRGTRCW